MKILEMCYSDGYDKRATIGALATSYNFPAERSSVLGGDPFLSWQNNNCIGYGLQRPAMAQKEDTD
ncbi:MAG: hypothetical protein IJ422_07790 [Oscillospiraceae bacterium]|nr:hypothetical protein [Oscillospiraceae bacterium]